MREGWKYKKLSDCCEVLNGFAFKSDKYVEAGTRVIRITNVQKGYIVDDDPKYYPDDEMSHLGQYCLYENDLLMSLTGNVGRVGLLQKEMLPAALNQRVACLRIKGRDISLRYLFHCLNSVVFEQKAIYSATGIAQKNMSTEWLKKYEIPVPSISEQERIVAELDCLSGVIEKQKRQLKELDNLIQAIFYDMFGDPITNEKGWEVKKLGEVCRFSQGVQVDVSLQSTEMKEGWSQFLRIVDYTTDNTDIRYVEVANEKYSVEYDDIVIVRYGASAGFVGINKKGILANNLFKLNHDRTFLHYKFLYYQLSTDYYRNFVKEVAFGAAMPALSFSSFNNFNIAIPPLSIQQEFACKIEAIEKQKELIKQSLSETETLFNSRMDYYFN